MTAATAGSLVTIATTSITLRATGSRGDVLASVASSVQKVSGNVTTPVIRLVQSLQCPRMFYYPASVKRLFKQTSDTGAVTPLTARSGPRTTLGIPILSRTRTRVSTMLTKVGPMNCPSRLRMWAFSERWMMVGELLPVVPSVELVLFIELVLPIELPVIVFCVLTVPLLAALMIGLYSYMLHA